MIRTVYGGPQVVELREIPKPQPKPNEVLVRVMAASVNKADWHILNGSQLAVRLMAGLFKPKYQILGADISGIVEQVGTEITQFKKGDEVFGDLSATGFGGFAEFVCTKENQLAKKPEHLSFEESAALPMAAVTALQGLRDKAELKQNETVLINGASGGVGSMAVQIAKALGGNVTAVCSPNNMKMALLMGADNVIDYKKIDFTRTSNQYDVIFDVIANHPIASINNVLKSGGRYVTAAFSMEVVLKGAWFSKKTKKRFMIEIASTSRADLQFIAKLAEENVLRPNIEQTFTLNDVPIALQKMGEGHSKGKFIITISK